MNQLLRLVLGLGQPVGDTLLEFCGYYRHTVVPLRSRSACRCDHATWEPRTLAGDPSAMAIAELASAVNPGPRYRPRSTLASEALDPLSDGRSSRPSRAPQTQATMNPTSMKPSFLTSMLPLGSLVGIALLGAAHAGSEVNLLGSAPTGRGRLLSAIRVAEGVLSVPGAGYPGFVCFQHGPIDPATRPELVFEVATAGGAIFLEAKTPSDDLVTDGKLLVEFPDTGGRPIRFVANLAPLLIHAEPVSVLVLSDPSGRGLKIRSITYEAEAPAGATRLHFDGRRFSTSTPDAPLKLPFPNLHHAVNYHPGGGISYSHTNSTLRLQPGSGWLWGYLPARLGDGPVSTDLHQNPYLSIAYRSATRASVSIELQNGKGQALIGSFANGVPKLALTLPRVRTPLAAVNFVTVDLRSEIISGVSDRNARIIAFSDPSGEIEILGYGLTAAKPPQQ